MPVTGVPELVATAALLSGVAGSAYYAVWGVRSQWLGPSDWRGRTDTGSVALTFDDGPGEDTEAVLDLLAAADVPATFFMIGRNVERCAKTAQRLVADGHDVGNHSYSHPIYLYRTRRETYRELARAQQVIADVTGLQPMWSRPPCGVRTPAYFAAAHALGLRTVQWTVAGFDWKKHTASAIASDVLAGADAGSIVLLHDADSRGRTNRRETVAALPVILEGLGKRQLTVVPLGELLPPEEPELPVDRAKHAIAARKAPL